MIITHPTGAVMVKTDGKSLLLTSDEFYNALRRGQSVEHNREVAIQKKDAYGRENGQ